MDRPVELEVMEEVYRALSRLGDDLEAVGRVLSWSAAHYGVSTRAPAGAAPADPGDPQNGVGASAPPLEAFCDLYASARPARTSHRALVAGYWLQAINGQPDFAGAEANRELRRAGYAVSNITDAMNTLIVAHPQLVGQTHKGRGKMARKRYKLTAAGIAKVLEMIEAAQSAKR